MKSRERKYFRYKKAKVKVFINGKRIRGHFEVDIPTGIITFDRPLFKLNSLPK